LGCFAVLGQLDHVRSLHEGVRAILAISNLQPKASLLRPSCHKDTSVWLEDLCQSRPNASEAKKFQGAVKISDSPQLRALGYASPGGIPAIFF
jgi:hypothetical protein